MEAIEEQLEEGVGQGMALVAEEASPQEISITEEGVEAVKCDGQGGRLVEQPRREEIAYDFLELIA